MQDSFNLRHSTKCLIPFSIRLIKVKSNPIMNKAYVASCKVTSGESFGTAGKLMDKF